MDDRAYDRQYLGVLIPPDLWAAKELSLQEKLMMAEIRALDVGTDRGCDRSNSYFAEYLNLSPSRVSVIIQGLAQKGCIEIAQRKDGKRIIERNIFVKKRYRGSSEDSSITPN